MLPKPHAKNSPGDVLIVIGDASETVDTLYPYFRLQESGFRPHVIAAEKTIAPDGLTRSATWVDHHQRMGGISNHGRCCFCRRPTRRLSWHFFSVEAELRNTFATTLTLFESHGTFLSRTSLWQVFAMVWKYQRMLAASKDDAWLPFKNVVTNWNLRAAFSSTLHVSWIKI